MMPVSASQILCIMHSGQGDKPRAYSITRATQSKVPAVMHTASAQCSAFQIDNIVALFLKVDDDFADRFAFGQTVQCSGVFRERKFCAYYRVDFALFEHGHDFFEILLIFCWKQS